MLTYIVAGPFPDVWKDMITLDQGHKNITITSNGDLLDTSERREGIKEPFCEDRGDGWLDFYITEQEITETLAKILVAKANNTTPDQIVFEYTEIPFNYKLTGLSLKDIEGLMNQATKNAMDIMVGVKIPNDMISELNMSADNINENT
jgi:hypothetical protein